MDKPPIVILISHPLKYFQSDGPWFKLAALIICCMTLLAAIHLLVHS
jgi:hypothetical protein